MLRQPYANAIEHFDPMNAAQWDLYIQSAEKHGVYLKLVIDEKNEWIRDHLGADGKMTATGSNDNFYAGPGHESALAGAGLVALYHRPLGVQHCGALV